MIEFKDLLLPFLVAMVSSTAFFGFIQFLINRRDAKKGKTKEIIDDLKEIKKDQKILKEGQDKLTMESSRVQVLTLLHTDPENVSAILKLSETYFVTLNGDTYVTDVFHDWIEDQTFSYPDWWLDICHAKGIEYDKDRNKHIREKSIKSREDKKE